MTPTPNLRFVERDSYYKNGEAFMFPHKIRVLQQWWDDDSWKHVNSFDADGKHISTGKWIDIPLEAEE